MVKLPIDEHIPALIEALTSVDNMVLRAEPGAGKTTRLPPALLPHISGKIYVLEPRRLAAKLAAERVAQEIGEACGQTVGYWVRQERNVSAKTRLVFVTEGLLVRFLRDESTLADVGCVILDEFHERNIHTDLALGMMRWLQTKGRYGGKIIVMSATVDLQLVGSFLGRHHTADVPGRTFPLTVEYRPIGMRSPNRSELKNRVLEMWEDPRCLGHILVFLTGLGEIFDVAAALRCEPKLRSADIVELAADLSVEQQRKAFQSSNRRKIILATNVAETSVTVPGVTGVIDTGLAKISNFAPWSGMPTLDVRRISRASCDQRAGRAGREQPGVVYRLFDEADYRGREAYTLPEIKRADISQPLLETLALAKIYGFLQNGKVEEFPWLERPSENLLDASYRLLGDLEAIDDSRALTTKGQRIVEVPLHPRLGALIVNALDTPLKQHALLAACLISESYVLYDQTQRLSYGMCDLCFQMDLLSAYVHRRASLSDTQLRALDRRRVDRVLRLYSSVAASLGMGSQIPADSCSPKEFASLLLRSFPDRVAKKSEKVQKAHIDTPSYHFCLGRGGRLSAQSVLQAPEFLISLEVREQMNARDAAQAAFIWYGTEISREQLLSAATPYVRKAQDVHLNERTGKQETYELTFYGECVVKEERLNLATTEGADLSLIVKERWPAPFSDDADLRSYHVRCEILEKAGFNYDLPRFEGEYLELLIADICTDKKSLREITERPLSDYIMDQLSYDQQQALHKLVPTQLKLANGRQINVRYDEQRGAYIEAHIQDFYGMSETVKIASGRYELTLVMIGPHKRPLHTGKSLASFWQGAYKEIRKELSRRYPRHFWPEDPTTAVPQLHLKKRH